MSLVLPVCSGCFKNKHVNLIRICLAEMLPVLSINLSYMFKGASNFSQNMCRWNDVKSSMLKYDHVEAMVQ